MEPVYNKTRRRTNSDKYFTWFSNDYTGIYIYVLKYVLLIYMLLLLLSHFSRV